MKSEVKFAFLGAAVLCGCLLFGKELNPRNLELVDRFHESIAARFADPNPPAFGMSRVATPISMGQHYRPIVTTTQRDFDPENLKEKEILAELEQQHLQVGLYVFGLKVSTSDAAAPDYRALKGPAAITAGTRRPSWYPQDAERRYVFANQLAMINPPAPKVEPPNPDALPDWNAIYPVARRAMSSFADGGKGFETNFGTWDLAVRPLLASQARCVGCHVSLSTSAIKIGQALGGVIYAFRQVEN